MAGYFLVLLLSKWFELVSATTQEAAFIFTWATCDIEHPIVLLQKQQFVKQKPVLPLKNEVNSLEFIKTILLKRSILLRAVL